MKLAKLNNDIKEAKGNKIRVSLISLGCEKNLVDSEMIMGLVGKNSIFDVASEVEKSDIVIINTCGFIKSAKEEALDTIFDCVNIKLDKRSRGESFKIVVCGCLVQRYFDDLKNNEDLSEVDLWIPIKDYAFFGEKLMSIVSEKGKQEPCSCNNLDFKNRLISTGNRLAYVKISEGCNNRCTYCAIPLIRGNFVSRKREDIIEEVRDLVKNGYYEICLISQDLSNYGYDIDDSLASLVREIDKIEGDYVIRLLYLYPDEITDDFIYAVRDSKHVLHYFDIPLQHASNKMLSLMHRRGTREEVTQLIEKIRKEIPDVVLRTTMIVGFPHESEKDFEEMLEFVHKLQFNHLGAFTFSKEDDTIAYSMNMQVSKKVKVDRFNRLMEEQKWVSLSKNKEFIGKKLKCLVEDYNDNEDVYVARSYVQAPDDIDGALYLTSSKVLEIGKVYEATITDCDFYDMRGIV